MKKNEKADGVSNMFNEFERIDLTGKALDDELTELGFDPKELVRKVRERIDNIKSGGTIQGTSSQENEFDPLLLAAGKRKRKQDSKIVRKKKD